MGKFRARFRIFANYDLCFWCFWEKRYNRARSRLRCTRIPTGTSPPSVRGVTGGGVVRQGHREGRCPSSVAGIRRVVPGDAIEGGGSLQTRPGQKIIADRTRQKILLPVPVLAVKNFGANVTGPEFFRTNRFSRIFFCQSNLMRSLKPAAWGGPALSLIDGPGTGLLWARSQSP